ncbi:MAG: RNA 2',3'-cyclic phosphodiesterase [Solirubrobacteraceae bacterium]
MTPERARLFVALELPDPARETLLAWRQSALSDNRGWRPVSGAGLHLTLCFLGDQRIEEIAAIAQACAAGLSERDVRARDAPALAAPVLTVAAPLLLGPRRARVLAVALKDPEQALAAVQGRLAHCLAEGGWYEPESRPYLPHVTLARARRGAQWPAGPAFPAPPALDFKPTTVSLLRSHLGGRRARYERLATVALARRDRR